MTEEFRRELINSTKKNDSLEHSAKGTTWSKKDHKYITKRKTDDGYYYVYDTVGVDDTEVVDYAYTLANERTHVDGSKVKVDLRDNTNTASYLKERGKLMSKNHLSYGTTLVSTGYGRTYISNGLSFVNRETGKPISELTVNFYAYKNRVKNWLKSLFE